MTAAHTGTVFGPLRKWVEEQNAHQLPDRELLQRFQANQDEAAFTALVQRYETLVLQARAHVLELELSNFARCHRKRNLLAVCVRRIASLTAVV
jgi:hypothetical protein